MAKGNLLLGTAGNSVGDVVMYRREGAQVSRVRVRKIKNPKTDAQSLQRAAFSPVAKFYSPLAVVLERSFEGLSKMKSYNKFLKTNIDLARANGWLLPKGTGFFPLPYKLSQGTLPSLSYSEPTNGMMSVNVAGVSEAPTTLKGFSDALIGAGYNSGDIVTVIMIGTNSAGSYLPIVGQFEVGNAESAASVAGMANFSFPGGPGSAVLIEAKAGLLSSVVACAVIVARFENDKWRRSTQSVVVATSLMQQISAADYKAAAIASYGMNAGDPNPLVYLDGDTLEG